MSKLEMEVVDIRKMTGEGTLRAFADVKFGEMLVIRGFSVIKGKNGVFVSMPKKAGKDGRWFETIQPLNDSFKREIEDRVLEAYDRETDGVSN